MDENSMGKNLNYRISWRKTLLGVRFMSTEHETIYANQSGLKSCLFFPLVLFLSDHHQTQILT